MFAVHIKSKNHQKWLENLNLNKANFYVENTILTTTLNNQKFIIAKLEKDIQTKIMTIDYLTQQLNRNTRTANLLDLD